VDVQWNCQEIKSDQGNNKEKRIAEHGGRKKFAKTYGQTKVVVEVQVEINGNRHRAYSKTPVESDGQGT